MRQGEARPWRRPRYQCIDAQEFLTGTFPHPRHWLTRFLYAGEVEVAFPLLYCSDQEGMSVTLGDITARFSAELHPRLAGRDLIGEHLYYPRILHLPGERTVLIRYDPRGAIHLPVAGRVGFAR